MQRQGPGANTTEVEVRMALVCAFTDNSRLLIGGRNWIAWGSLRLAPIKGYHTKCSKVFGEAHAKWWRSEHCQRWSYIKSGRTTVSKRDLKCTLCNSTNSVCLSLLNYHEVNKQSMSSIPTIRIVACCMQYVTQWQWLSPCRCVPNQNQ